MNKKALIEELKLRMDDRHMASDVLMRQHSSFKIGGPADLLIQPASIDELQHAMRVLKRHEVPVTLLGNGSNILVSDKGIRGAVIKISDKFSKMTVSGTTLQVEAGALLSSLANFATANGLAGLEFASGIPGTVGGAVFMNAGAYGGEMKDVVTDVSVLTDAGQVLVLHADELKFKYRSSVVLEKGWTVLGVTLQLTPDDPKAIQTRVNELTVKRTTKQPLQLPSAGSTFKRPEGHFAGKLIEDAGLRGVRFGDAAVSELHCGFVVNLGQATFEEVSTLIKFIQKQVYDTSGVLLETEVLQLGEGV